MVLKDFNEISKKLLHLILKRDTLNGKEIFPAHTDFGRKTIGRSEFNVKLTPKNFGVLLRRKLDYQFPNQRAEVFVAKIRNGKPVGEFKRAGKLPAPRVRFAANPFRSPHIVCKFSQSPKAQR